MKSIRVSELKTILDRLIQKLEDEHGKDGKLEIQTLHYRIIPTHQWNDFDKIENWSSAPEIGLGDLDDDLMELRKLIDDKERIATYVDFDRVSSILREISQVQNPL